MPFRFCQKTQNIWQKCLHANFHVYSSKLFEASRQLLRSKLKFKCYSLLCIWWQVKTFKTFDISESFLFHHKTYLKMTTVYHLQGISVALNMLLQFTLMRFKHIYVKYTDTFREISDIFHANSEDIILNISV